MIDEETTLYILRMNYILQIEVLLLSILSGVAIATAFMLLGLKKRVRELEDKLNRITLN